MTFTKVVGTPTYMAPRIFCQGKVKRTEVNSFGTGVNEFYMWAMCSCH